MKRELWIRVQRNIMHLIYESAAISANFFPGSSILIGRFVPQYNPDFNPPGWFSLLCFIELVSGRISSRNRWDFPELLCHCAEGWLEYSPREDSIGDGCFIKILGWNSSYYYEYKMWNYLFLLNYSYTSVHKFKNAYDFLASHEKLSILMKKKS